jgi:hypothetical protein
MCLQLSVPELVDPREESLCERQEGEVEEGQNDGRKAGWHSWKAGNRAEKFSAVQTSAEKQQYAKDAFIKSKWPVAWQKDFLSFHDDAVTCTKPGASAAEKGRVADCARSECRPQCVFGLENVRAFLESDMKYIPPSEAFLK